MFRNNENLVRIKSLICTNADLNATLVDPLLRVATLHYVAQVLGAGKLVMF